MKTAQEVLAKHIPNYKLTFVDHWNVRLFVDMSDNVSQLILSSMEEYKNEAIEAMIKERNELQQCLWGLNGAIDEYWNDKFRGEKGIKKICDWQQTSLRILTK